MKPELMPGSGVRNGGRQRGINERGDASLADCADLGQCKRNLVSGKCDRLGVEISARDDLSGLNQHQRIVRDSVGFDRQRARSLCQQVKHGAGHLWLAAQTIRILHALVALEVRLANVARSHSQGYCHLLPELAICGVLNVRFAPDSGRIADIAEGPKWGQRETVSG
jgi:hypothetical protein